MDDDEAARSRVPAGPTPLEIVVVQEAGEPRRRLSLAPFARAGRRIGDRVVNATAIPEAKEGASFIRGLVRTLLPSREARRRGNPNLALHDDGTIDMEMTAARLGIYVDELDARLARRQNDTRRMALTYAGCAIAVFVYGLGVAAMTDGMADRLILVVSTLAVVAALLALALSQSFTNWQVGSRRMASLGEFLARGDIWPRRAPD